MKSVQKFLLMILIVILTISCMAGCSKNVEEEIRLAMYEVNFDGTRLNQYPKHVFTDRELLEKILVATGPGPFETNENVYIAYSFGYFNEENNEIIVHVANNGEATFMSIGLPQARYFLTEKEYKEFETLLFKKIQAK